MKLGKVVINLFLLSTLSACGFFSESREEPIHIPAPTPVNQKQTEILLQEPFTRVIARCYASAEYAANACAAQFEQKGYVRLRNIPYKTARYDFLTQDTYPTRRWRENELTPRW